MRVALAALVLVASVLVSACGPGISGGPTMNNHVGTQEDESAPAIQSNDVMARDAVTRSAKVKHILISWKDLADSFDGRLDARAAKRTRAEGDALAAKLLERVRAGEDMDALMAEFSEDPGSKATGEAYTVTPDAQYVFEFKRMGLRLGVGEAGLVLSQFGWHVMKRVE